jgi:hypothetical protein
MRDASGALWKLAHTKTPLGLVIYSDYTQRDELISELELLAPSGIQVLRATTLDEAHPLAKALVLLTPPDEGATVLELDGRREHFLDRQVPLLLFLLRGGEGLRVLADAPGLASWLSGSEVEPERLQNLDVEAETRAFLERTGKSPEAWLAAYAAGEVPESFENILLTHRARLLGGTP